ncbi:MAG: hypothetical protein ABH882_06245, partial [Candidatus Omnitrophota bacterium]
HMGYRLKGKRPIEVLLDKTTCPKRLTYDKIDTPTNVEVSTHLPTCTHKTKARSERPSERPAQAPAYRGQSGETGHN